MAFSQAIGSSTGVHATTLDNRPLKTYHAVCASQNAHACFIALQHECVGGGAKSM